MPVFTDALIGDTLHLSAEEFGAYCLILFATWRNNGRALPDDDRKLARICRTNIMRWRKSLRPKLVGFFNLEDGFWHQKRLEKEWSLVHKKIQNATEVGKRGAAAKWLKYRQPELPEAEPEQSKGNGTHTPTQGYIYNKYINTSSPHAREGLPPETPWPNRCRAWAEGARWMPDWGPSPDEPGCWAPAKLVTEARKQRGGD